jgi:cytochrome c551/c552
MARCRQRMPNRNGMTLAHAMWPGRSSAANRKPDVQGKACMSNCAVEPVVALVLPDFARNAAWQPGRAEPPGRAQRGADTTRPEVKAVVTGRPCAPAARPQPRQAPHRTPGSAAGAEGKAAQALAKSTPARPAMRRRRSWGPAGHGHCKKHAGNADYLVGKIRSGGTGVWGAIPMPAQTLSDADARAIANWLAAGAAS